MGVHLELSLGEDTPTVAERLAAWDDEDLAARLWQKDHTVWFDEDLPELTNRLGWLDLPDTVAEGLDDLRAFGDDVAAAGFSHAVVLGMGGSSLAPEVYQATFGNAEGRPELLVLDSTHPAAVLAVEERVDLLSTLFIVSSKSGGTLETLSFFRYFWSRLSELSADPGQHFVAVTDEGSSLETLAAERSFRRVFFAPPDVGGRYSALTPFGLVPAAAIGVDLDALAAGARAAAAASGPAVSSLESPGIQLGAAMAELTSAGRDKVTFVTSSSLAAFPAWIEQLIAESTGKDDRGIVPIGGEEVGGRAAYGRDRFFVGIDTEDDPVDAILEELGEAGHPVARLTLDSLSDLGGAMFLFEVAVAVAGAGIGIHPFNQPDVQLAKDLAKQAMAGELDTGGVVEIPADDDDLGEYVDSWLSGVTAGDYVGIQAFIQPTADARDVLEAAQHAIRDHWRVATTLDFGPRFLHSTGQLHKGGANTGVFLQLIDRPAPVLDVPETEFSFGELVTAQALGDHLALRSRRRRVLLVSLGDDVAAGLAAVGAAIDGAAR